MNFLKRIPSSLRFTVFCTSIRYGSPKDFDLVFDAADKEMDQVVKSDLLLGLSCSKEQWQLLKYLSSQLEGDIDIALNYVAINRNGYLLAWYFLKNNWGEIYFK